MHVLLVKCRRENLDVSTATVDVLFVLDGELNDGGFSLVGELVELGGHGVELGILASLDTLVLLSVTVKFTGAQREFTQVVFVLGVNPPALPVC